MKKNHITLLLLATAVTLLTATSCKKEYFDEEKYNDFVDDMFQVDGIDKNHDWCLTKDDTITIKTPESRIYSVEVLTADLRTASNPEIIAEGVCYGDQAELAYTVPVVATNIYIAALDQDGKYLGITSVPFGTKEIELAIDDLQPIGSKYTIPTYQTFTYLYVCTFPLPSEAFDYNDMALRISKKNTRLENSLTVDLHVTLKAAGTKEPYAGAIQLADIKYSDIDKVEIVEGKPMDDGYPLMRQYITSDAPLICGRNGEAVINLFESAHWAFGKQRDEVGNIIRLIYNTTPSVQENYSSKADPINRTYRIYFKDRNKARMLTLNRVDPFLIHEYNGGKWEIHTYAHKFDEVLNSVFTNKAAYDNHMSWALIIPKADFKYPIEGMSLSTFDNELEETFGPYEGFVGWMKDHTTHHNWYLNLKRPDLVYQE
ncbi:MAG: DUF4842 domain-containing protein [Prevotella sp.]|nr:DUF4842 domain-containing protein [Prevotella sp.]